MVFADDIRRTILKLAEERGSDKSFAPWEVARAVDQKNWRMIIDQVTLVAGVLIREGKIIAITRSKRSQRFRKTL
jgi:Protein of unknown function (DUF3253)